MKETKTKNLKYYAYYFLILFLFSCSKCKQPFEPNPNLRLLLREEGYNLGNPVWTKSGWIYYTKQRGYQIGDWYGSVWRIKEDGTQNELVIDGVFRSIDVSLSETLLIAVGQKTKKVYVFNINTQTLDSLHISSVYWTKFGEIDSVIYYSKKENNETGGIYRYNLLSYVSYLLKENVSFYWFDIYKDSLICYYDTYQKKYYIYDILKDTSEELLHGGYFNPSNPDMILFEDKVKKLLDDIVIFYTDLNKLEFLNAYPYEKCEISIYNWDKKGMRVVFNASPYHRGDPSWWGPFELWILEKF